MTTLVWRAPDSSLYEAGVDRGVFYPQEGPGVVWNGLVSVNETPSGAESEMAYQDGHKYQNGRGVESFSATIEAFTYPLEFSEYDGYDNLASGQGRKQFGFSYRTRLGNGLVGPDFGYKIHLVYNALATPSTRSNRTLSAAQDPSTFSWDISTQSMFLPGVKPSAHFVVYSTAAYPWVVSELEEILYGNAENAPRLPNLEELLELFESGAILKIIDHGDGTWSAIGPDEAIRMLDSTTFEISWPSAVYLDSETYKISSL